MGPAKADPAETRAEEEMTPTGSGVERWLVVAEEWQKRWSEEVGRGLVKKVVAGASVRH